MSQTLVNRRVVKKGGAIYRKIKLQELNELVGYVEPESDCEKRQPSAEPKPKPKLQRCEGCGGMVYMPCVLCIVRASQGSPNCNVELPNLDDIQAILAATESAGVDVMTDSLLDQTWSVV